MKSLVLLILMIIVLQNCRKRKLLDKKLKKMIGPNRYFIYSFIPATGKNNRRLREGEESDTNAAVATQPAEVSVSEDVKAGEVCDVEVRDYKQIKICGCRYWGFRCKAYLYFVDENILPKTKIQAQQFHVQSLNQLSKEDSDKQFEEQLKGIISSSQDFTLFMNQGDCIKLCTEFRIFQNIDVAEAYAKQQAKEGEAPAKYRLKKRYRRHRKHI